MFHILLQLVSLFKFPSFVVIHRASVLASFWSDRRLTPNQDFIKVSLLTRALQGPATELLKGHPLISGNCPLTKRTLL